MELDGAPDERTRRDGIVGDSAGQRRPNARCVDRGALSLDGKRLDVRELERRGDPIEGRARRIDLARRGARGDPRGKVDGVTHHAVAATGRWPEVGAERVATIDANAN